MEFALAAIVALALTPLAAAIARRTGVVDRPGPFKTQQRPVPYLGGAAVFAAIAVGVVATHRLALFAPLGLAFGLGVIDDVRGLPPGVRLCVEVVVGVVAGLVVPGMPIVRIATAGFAVVLMNAVNLLDGQDGLAGSVGLVAALGLALLGGGARPLGLAAAGGLAGFLVFNRPPARIYLGDGGAYLVGTALALMTPLTAHGSTSWSVWLAAPLLVALPILDTAIAVLRRLRAHRSLFAGDRSHVYDQLVDRGLTVGASTIVCATAQTTLSVLGVLAAGLAPAGALGVTLAATTVAAAVAWRGRLV